MNMKLEKQIKEQAMRTKIIFNYTPETETGCYKKMAKENMEFAESLLKKVNN